MLSGHRIKYKHRLFIVITVIKCHNTHHSVRLKCLNLDNAYIPIVITYIHYVVEYSAKCIVMVLQFRVSTYLYTDYMVNQNAIQYVRLVL